MSSVRAPELETDLGWLNTDRPLRFDGDLRGRVVVLDFWTYCCINCMHVLPDLAALEDQYADEPVVFIGVHSAKFDNEADRETIRAAVLRYEIRHPVVIDHGMRLWRAYAARSWPTLVVIDGRGMIVGQVAGEGQRDVIDRAIAEALTRGRADGALADGPLRLRREVGVRAAGGLAFPGKVLADEPSRRIYVCDSNHNRIVIAEWPDDAGRCRVVRVVGRGTIGADDGDAGTASFNHPQGLAVGHGLLYVADTENHLIRTIDLTTYAVSTLVGTGVMDNDRAGGGMGTAQGLNSPWDLALEGSTLYVAMAGVHQIWRIDLPVGFARALAGSGRENIVDGPAELAALAQPSGLCILGGRLFFADSEVSAVRGIDLASERVFTVIGEGLFSFGDVDGPHPQARLQHPLGIAAWKDGLLIADTYNHKIKHVDPGARAVTTVLGTGRPGTASDGGDRPAFFEPGGLSVAGDEVFVADTNNHRIVHVDLSTRRWRELSFDGLEPPRAHDADDDADVIEAPAARVAPGRDVRLVLDVRLPPGARLNREAPWSVRVRAGGVTLAQRTGRSDHLPIEVIIPARDASAHGPWRVDVSLAYCTDSDRGLCAPVQAAWIVPVTPDGTGDTVRLTTDVMLHGT